VQNDSKFSSDGNLGFTQPGLLRNPDAPGFERFIASVRVATDKLSWMSAVSFASPTRCRHRVSDERSNGSRCWKNSSPQKNWKWILDPAVRQRLIAQVVRVLEKRQACHQVRGNGGSRGHPNRPIRTAPPKTANRSRERASRAHASDQ
jgi:hypothetical protein